MPTESWLEKLVKVPVMLTRNQSRLLRTLCMVLLVLIATACNPLEGSLRAKLGDRPTPAPVTRASEADQSSAAAFGIRFPHYVGKGPVVRSTERPSLNLQRLGVSFLTPERLILDVALYNNSDDEALSLDPQAIFEQGAVTNGEKRVLPEKIEVEQGNTGKLIPRSGLIARLHYRPPSGETLNFQLPNFPEQPLGLDGPALESAPTITPLSEGLWRGGAPVVPSSDIPGVAMQVVDMRIRGNRMIVNLGFVNLQEKVVNGVDSSLTGHDLRLIDGRGLAYKPIEVEPVLVESIAPTHEWLPGELHQGLIHFPRPTSGPVRLEFPTFPPLSLRPAQRPIVALTTEEDYPPHDSLPVTIPSPSPLTNEWLATPVTRSDMANTMEKVAGSLVGGKPEAFFEHFREDARSQMERWWAGIASTPITSPRFSMRHMGDVRGSLITDASYLLFYRLEGDSRENRFMLPVTLDFSREGKQWYITRWESDVPVWAQEWKVSESDHFLLLADAAVAEASGKFIDEAESAYSEIAERLEPLRLHDRYVMIVPASETRFRELTERGHETQGVATSRYLIGSDTIETNSLSFVLNGEAMAAVSAEERKRTMAHELVHLLLTPVTRSYSPAWVIEGTATHFSEETPWETLRTWITNDGLESISLVALTEMDQFADWSQPQTVPVQYAYSAALIAYLIEEYGEERFLNFYSGYANNELSQKLRTALKEGESEEALRELRVSATQKLLEKSFNIVSIEQLEEAFERWLLREAPR